MTEPVDAPCKRSRSNADDLNECADYTPDVKSPENQADTNKSFSNENVASQNNDDNNSNLRHKPTGTTLSSVLSKPMSFVRPDVRSLDGHHRKTTTPENLLTSGYGPNESKYADYDSDDSDYDGADGGDGRTPVEDYESEEEEEEEEEADDNQDYDEESAAN